MTWAKGFNYGAGCGAAGSEDSDWDGWSAHTWQCDFTFPISVDALTYREVLSCEQETVVARLRHCGLCESSLLRTFCK